MSSADADDPPRSRLFVVCPKGTGQDTLQRAFEDLLAKLSADPPFAARGRRRLRGRTRTRTRSGMNTTTKRSMKTTCAMNRAMNRRS